MKEMNHRKVKNYLKDAVDDLHYRDEINKEFPVEDVSNEDVPIENIPIEDIQQTKKEGKMKSEIDEELTYEEGEPSVFDFENALIMHLL